ncbi:MAG: hypothetical protein ACLU0O_09975 [Collinsella sp.]
MGHRLVQYRRARLRHRACNAAGDTGGNAQNAQIDKDCRGLQRHGGNAQLAYIVQHGGSMLTGTKPTPGTAARATMPIKARTAPPRL